MTLHVTPSAGDALEALHAADDKLAERVERALDLIESDPHSPAVRRRQMRPAQCWMYVVPVDGDQNDVAILWALEGGDPLVRYIGPASFA
ncbi:MAG: hypothetical protein M3Q87_07345 [Actinomycetota bacterium]|nr:hypothetical protein [Actinomycetota bacterium]